MKENEKACGMLKTLISQASTAAEPDSEGFLLHGVYAYAEGKGVDEPDLWGTTSIWKHSAVYVIRTGRLTGKKQKRES